MPATHAPPEPGVTVVDDEPYIRDILSRAASSWHYHCQTASSGEQALQLLERQPTPVVVTDMRMPGRGGLWLVNQIRQRWPEIGIIVLTAADDLQTARQCLDAGAHHYFLKPIKLEEFHHVLATASRTYLTQSEERRYKARLEADVRRQTRRVRRTFLSGIESLARTVEERDPYTAGHSLRVHEYAMALARAAGLAPRPTRELSLAARLHDIGKVGVPEGVLNKPARLTDDEFAIIRNHPAAGEHILKPMIRNWSVLAAIRGHHERLDGTGYPDGLKGDDVPLLARFIAVTDVFDAVTSSRAYREAMGLSDALGLLREGAGNHLDPELVRVFLDIAPALTCGQEPLVG
jgi:response regulator RpfG family c-di-GMP phosphodiesterase